MKITPKILLLFIVVLNSYVGFSQQTIDVSIVFDSATEQFQIRQDILFKNTSSKPISSIILNDWNNAYSDKKSHLGRRFSDEFSRNFHLSREKERGYTKIENVSVNSNDVGWNRINNQIDLIEIPLKEKLNSGDSVQLHLEYILKFPDSKFTRYGNDKGIFYLKDFLLSIARINQTGEFVKYSNENIDDAVYEKIQSINLRIQLPFDYNVTSNLILVSQNKTEKNEWLFEGKNLHEIQFSLEKNNTFEVYKNEKAEIETNLYGSRITGYQKAIIIDRVINFTEERLGKSITSKYLISQTEYDRNPFYGLNQLPGFLSPFPNSFLFELKFLKIYTANYLKQNLNIDFRKDHHIYDAIQTFTIISYIEEHYPDLKLLGGLSQFKIIKGYQIAKADFNDQYHLLYMLMARKNLDQSLTESKENLVKFNEQISNRYKAGIAYVYLNKYLRNNGITNSFLKFTNLNRLQKTELYDFKKVLNQNVGTAIPWFFDNVITTEKEIDFTFGKIQKENDDLKIVIQNKTKRNVPFSITGFKKRKKIFENWYPPTQIDTTVIVQNTNADKLIINHKNEIPEINNRDNYKSLKGFLSLNKPIKFSFLKDIENPAYHQIYYFPEVGFNVYDGAIISLKFNNKSLIEKPFSFSLAPSLSTKTASVTGFGIINYTQQRKNSDLFQIKYSLAGAYYHYIQDASYLRITPIALFKFRNNDNLRDNFWQTLSIRQVIVTKEDSPLISENLNPLNYSVTDLRYGLGDGETAKTYSLLGNLQLSGQFGKLTFETLYRKLFENNYQFGLRLYAGTFLYKNTTSDYFNFALDRPKDYLFDYEYYGRSENSGLFSQQIIIAEGGFKSKFSDPYANQWMTTLNTTSSIWKWIQLYGDAGIYKNKGSQVKFVYDSGIQFSLVPDYFELFFPVYSSNGFELSQKNYNEKIRFMITLNPKTLINLFTRKWF